MDELGPPKIRIKLPRRKRVSLLALLLLIFSAFYAGKNYPDKLTDAAQTIQQHQPGLYPVRAVIDGDTIEVDSLGKTEIVRMIGIDTPETKDPRKPVQCFGDAAFKKNQELLSGKSVRLEADPTDSDRDKYKRLLRYVYLPDNTLVNLELVRQGYAFAYTIYPNQKIDQFRRAEIEARQNNLGLWAGCNVDESKGVKQTTGQR